MKSFASLVSTVSILLGVLQQNAFASPDWNEGAEIPATGRANIFEMPDEEFKASVERGRLHAVVYPVEVTGLLLPYQPLVTIMSDKNDNFIKRFIRSLFRDISGFQNEDQIYEWLGLAPYPLATDSGIYSVPYPNAVRPNYRMGVSLIDVNGATGLTFACAACHSSNLFGKTVLGMPNKVTRANEFFLKGKEASSKVELNMFRYISNATDAEMKMLTRARDNLRFVDARKPQVYGLDTSLAHTALALSRRARNGEASKNIWYTYFPHGEPLSSYVADSKPAPWWNLKFKNRWLLDGSVVSGNPVFTNILWNELGRGADLKQIEGWLARNESTVKDLTNAVFANEAPLYSDFFEESSIDIASAKRGEQHFIASCAKCHGTYEKAWSREDSSALSWKEQIKTVEVRYHTKTPVIDVGTDSNRHAGMKSLFDNLNRLNFSKKNNIVVKQQHGYVPPPLVGVWARWPYFHNNSVPSLCAVLTRTELRPKVFYTGESHDKTSQFDARCNGYPIGNATPREWTKVAERKFDTTRPGLSNRGHDERIFLADGVEIYTDEDKMDIIEFLKTL